MIIKNGEIRFVEVIGGGGIDSETGYPLKPNIVYGDPKPCQVVPLSVDYLGTTKEDGRFVRASYEILIDSADDVITAERVMVKTEDGLLVSREFSVTARIPLVAVGQTTLLV